MDIVSFIPILLILGAGFLILIPLNRLFHLKLPVLDIFLHSFIIGVALIVFPLIWFGVAPLPVFFEGWIFLLATLSILALIIGSFYYLKKILKYNFSENLALDRNMFFFVLILLLVSIYLIYALLLPLRGYDALWIYLPNALWFYLNASIPYLNGLNFVPTVKEPLNSLLYTFALYLTGNFSIELFPVIFFIFWAILTYKLCLKIFPDQHTLALLSLAMFLAFPANIWFMDQWAYYQDIYLGFFFTATVYFFLESQHSEQTNYYTVLTGLCLALSLVSKLSGWSLFFILPLLLQTGKRGKIILSWYTGLLFLFLGIEGSYRLYIGIIPVFILFFLLLMYHLWDPQKKVFIHTHTRAFFTVLFIGLVLGGYWLYSTLQKFSFLASTLTSAYWNLGSSLLWTFKAADPSSSTYIFESAQAANFFGIIVILLIGYLFAVLWAFPKVISLLKRWNHSFLVIWVLIFFSIWVVFESTASIRYLTPVFSPLIILVLKGWFITKDTIQSTVRKRSLLLAQTHSPYVSDSFQTRSYTVSHRFALFILSSGIVSLYIPILSFSTSAPSLLGSIAQAYVYSEYLYYNNWFLVLILVLGLPSLVILLILYHTAAIIQVEKFKHNIVNNKKISTTLSVFFVCILIIIPLVVPGTVLALNNFNVQQFQQTYDYEDRGAVQDIVAHIIADNNPSAAILTFNTPGLSLWTDQPTIDIFQQSGLLGPLFTSQNITEGLDLLLHPFNYLITNYSSINVQNVTQPLITYIVVPNYGNLYYQYYLNQFKSKSYVFPMLEHQKYFKLLYTNTEFRLYKRIYVDPFFQGVFDVGVTHQKINNSILGVVSNNMTLGSSIHGYLALDLSQAPNQVINVTIQITYLSENVLSYYNTTYSTYHLNTAFTSIPWSIPVSNNTIMLKNISGLVEYHNNHGVLLTLPYSFGSTSTIPISNVNGEYQISSGTGLE